MTEPSRPLSWPAAPRIGAVVVQHPAWEEARNAVLDLAAEGPVTVFLTGEPGSGKTWLLRELAASLGEHGFPTMALLRGDLPIPLGDGVAVLVDEASYMPETTRAELAIQDRGVVVLADIGPFTAPSSLDGLAPVQIHLRLLGADEVGSFVTDWLHGVGLASTVVDPCGLLRLFDHSGGAVRLIAQLLMAATSLTRADGHLHVTGDLIDEVAAFRLGASMREQPARMSAPPVPTPPVSAPLVSAPLVSAPLVSVSPVASPILRVLPPAAPSTPVARPSPPMPDRVVPAQAARPPRRRAAYRWAMVGSIAASVAALIAVSGLPPKRLTGQPTERPPLQSAQIALPDTLASVPPLVAADHAAPEPATAMAAAPAPAATTQASAPALPPLQVADIPAPAVVAPAAPPMLAAGLPTPSLAVASTQATAPRTVSPPVAAATAIAVASAAPPSVVPVIATNAVALTPAIAHPVTSGLVLVAQRGDTLERLYADIYRDRRAPPFAAILAANPIPFRPGAVVVFPEPIGGWGRAQR